ncbi:MAG: stage III sporulation protein AF [Clostridiales bacterium]|nr:stage III sporulation protein AF [Clostridiales bacterium]
MNMDTVYSYTLLIAALAVLCALFECLIPQGKTKSVVLFVMGLLFLLGIVTPLVALSKESAAFELPADKTTESANGAPPSHEEILRGYYEEYIEQ